MVGDRNTLRCTQAPYTRLQFLHSKKVVPVSHQGFMALPQDRLKAPGPPAIRRGGSLRAGERRGGNAGSVNHPPTTVESMFHHAKEHLICSEILASTHTVTVILTFPTTQCRTIARLNPWKVHGYCHGKHVFTTHPLFNTAPSSSFSSSHDSPL